MQQLSTSKRINSAADDVAGLAIGTRLTSQIKGANQAIRNANDGISLLQTAEGAIEGITNALQRMRELRVQSLSETNNPADKASIENEITSLQEEIGRIVKTTQFNGANLLDGFAGTKKPNGNIAIAINNQDGQNSITASAPPDTQFTKNGRIVFEYNFSGAQTIINKAYFISPPTDDIKNGIDITSFISTATNISSKTITIAAAAGISDNAITVDVPYGSSPQTLAAGTPLLAADLTHHIGQAVNAIVAGDFDKNGTMDLAVTVGHWSNPYIPDTPDQLRILLGDGKGDFVDGNIYSTGPIP